MNWKEHGLKYEGYLDDILIVGFGIEDGNTAGIDVTAEDLLFGIGLCDQN
jgi:hypothetical protein